MNLSPKNLDALLALVSKKIGTTPEELKSNLQKGDLSQLTKGMSEEEKEKLNKTLADKELTKKVVSSFEVENEKGK